MPYRSAAGILMALAGLVAVAGLIVIGIDVYAARQRGPRWKRRLLGAGLAVFGILGVWLAKPKPVVACYMPRPEPFTAPSLQRLGMQTSLLYLLTAEGRLEPEAARKALAAAENALAEASAPETLKGLSPEERNRAERLIQHARAQIDQLKARLDASPPTPAKPAASLEDTAEWKSLVAAWKWAEATIADTRFRPRSDPEEVERMLGVLDEAAKGIDSLAAAKLLNPAEADLLRRNLANLTARADEALDPPLGGVACYLPLRGAFARDGAARLDERLPLLERLVAQEKIAPIVLQRILVRMEDDLADLSKEEHLKQLDPAERTKVGQTRETCAPLIARLKALPQAQSRGGGLDDAAKLDSLRSTFDEAYQVASRIRLLPDQRSNRKLAIRLKGALVELDALTAAGCLTEAEAGLVKLELAKQPSRVLGAGVAAPLDARSQFPAVASMRRLSAYRPLLEQLTAQDRVRPELARLVLAAVALDLRPLSPAEEKLVRSSEADNGEAAFRNREAVEALVEKLRKRVEAGK